MIKTWYATIQKALASPEVKTQYANQGMVPTGSASPEDFDRFFRADYDRLVKLVSPVDIAGLEASEEVTFSDYGADFDISAPPADQVTTKVPTLTP